MDEGEAVGHVRSRLTRLYVNNTRASCEHVRICMCAWCGPADTRSQLSRSASRRREKLPRARGTFRAPRAQPAPVKVYHTYIYVCMQRDDWGSLRVRILAAFFGFASTAVSTCRYFSAACFPLLLSSWITLYLFISTLFSNSIFMI